MLHKESFLLHTCFFFDIVYLFLYLVAKGRVVVMYIYSNLDFVSLCWDSLYVRLETFTFRGIFNPYDISFLYSPFLSVMLAYCLSFIYI